MQPIVDWLLLGSFYAAVALGFSLVWGIMNIINLAHGVFIITGAYIAFQVATRLHLSPFLALFFSMGILFALGWVIQYGIINRVIRGPLLVTFLLTFGLELLLTDTLQNLFTSDNRFINSTIEGVGINLGSAHISLVRFISAAIAIVLTAALAAFLSRTRLGNAIPATGMDRDAARLMGIDIRQIYALTFAISAALAGAAGALLGQMQAFYPTRGELFTLRSFAIVVLGGLGTPWAVVAGGMVFAFIETFLPVVLPSVGVGYENAVAFAVFVIVLLVRPTGLFGKAFYSQ